MAERLAGRSPDAVVISPETALSELSAVRSAIAAGASREPALEALVFGRQQVLHTRDQLGRAEGIFAPPEGAARVGVALEDTKGYVFLGDVDRTGTRLYNARVTNLAGALDELQAAGVSTFHVVQADLDATERDAFERGGLEALAAFASRERSTTGHLFRGVV